MCITENDKNHPIINDLLHHYHIINHLWYARLKIISMEIYLMSLDEAHFFASTPNRQTHYRKIIMKINMLVIWHPNQNPIRILLVWLFLCFHCFACHSNPIAKVTKFCWIIFVHKLTTLSFNFFFIFLWSWKCISWNWFKVYCECDCVCLWFLSPPFALVVTWNRLLCVEFQLWHIEVPRIYKTPRL